MANSEYNLPSSKLVDGEVNRQQAPELEDEESFPYAVQLVMSTALSMSLQSVTELGVFDAIQSAGTGAKLSAREIASLVSCKNPEAPATLDRILALLASHSILRCTVVPDEQRLGSFVRLYSMAPVAKYFARDSDGVSIAPLMALIQDKVFLESWLVPVPYHQINLIMLMIVDSVLSVVSTKKLKPGKGKTKNKKQKKNLLYIAQN